MENDNNSGSKFYRKLYRFQVMEDWSHELYRAAQDFYNDFSIYPNVMQSNPFTHSQIDRIANSEEENHLYDPAGDAPADGSYVRLGSFCTDSFEIDFCYEMSMQHPDFYLIFDEEYDGGGEEIEEFDDEDLSDIRAAV